MGMTSELLVACMGVVYHLGSAPGLHPRRYARQVLQVLQVVLRDPTHLLAARMTTAEVETASKSGQTGDILTADSILPPLIKRVSEFAAVRDLSNIAVQVLSAAESVQQRLNADTDGHGLGRVT